MPGAGERRALVAGASGLVGGECVATFLASPEYAEVVALVRQPLPQDHPRLQQVMIDFDQIGAGLGSRRVDDGLLPFSWEPCDGTDLSLRQSWPGQW